ncbi:Laminin subunit gamma-1, partial [Eumeta japonica]
MSPTSYRCKPGFFNMDIENEFGCTPCFCYGHSSACRSAPKYIRHSAISHFIRDVEKWGAQDDHRQSAPLQYNANSQNI